jgi:hypothetical protein
MVKRTRSRNNPPTYEPLVAVQSQIFQTPIITKNGVYNMSPLNFITNAPLWVWPLLALLISFGFIATRERTTLIAPLYGLPFLGILSLSAVNALTISPSVWALFFCAYIIGAWRGFVFQEGIILFKSRTHVTLSGEWVTMIVVMTIFWMNFVGGAMQAVAPTTYASTTFHVIFASIAGLTAGVFLGRALRLMTSPSEVVI